MDLAGKTLFGKARRAVLGLLFEEPEHSYHLREIARLTGIGPGSLQAELNKLHAADLVQRNRDGNRVVYRANADHPVFESLRDIVRKTFGLPRQLEEALQPLADRIVFAGIYGSIAKSRSHARSDVDVLIVGSVTLDDALAALVTVEERIGREISVRIFSPVELRERMARDDPFLKSVVDGPMTPIVGELDDTR